MMLDMTPSSLPGMLRGTWMSSRKAALPFLEEPHALFTEQEDDTLKELVKRHGTKRWHIIAIKMQNKTPRECRTRWQTHLNRCLNKSTWNAEEDRLLLEGHNAYGNRWIEIAKLVPGRKEMTSTLFELNHIEKCSDISSSQESVWKGEIFAKRSAF